MKKILKSVGWFLLCAFVVVIAKSFSQQLYSEYQDRARSKEAIKILDELKATELQSKEQFKAMFIKEDSNWAKAENRESLNQYTDCWWKNMVELFEVRIEEGSPPKKGDGSFIGKAAKEKCKGLLSVSKQAKGSKVNSSTISKPNQSLLDKYQLQNAEDDIKLNEELISDIYNKENFASKNIDFETFMKDIADYDLQRALYDNLNMKDKGITFSEFQQDLGFPTNYEQPLKTIPETERLITEIEIEGKEHDLGELVEGVRANGIIKVKNIGNSPLIISSAKGWCGCLIPKWPSEPINPGEYGEIQYELNTYNLGSLEGQINTKRLSFTANTTPLTSYFTVKAKVFKK